MSPFDTTQCQLATVSAITITTVCYYTDLVVVVSKYGDIFALIFSKKQYVLNTSFTYLINILNDFTWSPFVFRYIDRFWFNFALP